MQQATKRFQLTFGVLSLGYIVLGLLQILAPNSSRQVICTILGIAAIAVGILRIAMFFMKKEPTRVSQNDLAVGAVLLMGGVYVIINGSAIWAWLPVIVGFAIVFDSIIKLQYAFELKRVSYHYWWLAMVAALVSTVLAVLLVLDRFEGDLRHYYWAIVMILDGIFNLITMVLLTIQLRRREKGKPSKERKPKKVKAEITENNGDEADADAAAQTAEDVIDALRRTEESIDWNDEL